MYFLPLAASLYYKYHCSATLSDVSEGAPHNTFSICSLDVNYNAMIPEGTSHNSISDSSHELPQDRVCHICSECAEPWGYRTSAVARCVKSTFLGSPGTRELAEIEKSSSDMFQISRHDILQGRFHIGF